MNYSTNMYIEIWRYCHLEVFIYQWRRWIFFLFKWCRQQHFAYDNISIRYNVKSRLFYTLINMSTTAVDSEILGLQQASQMTYAYGALVLIIFGTVGNLLNILVFTRLRILRQMPSATFLITSFTFNFVQLWITRFSRSVQNFIGFDLLTRSVFYCEIRWLLGPISACVSMTSLCLVRIDRFLVTSHNVRYHRVFNLRRTRIIVGTIVLIFCIQVTPYIVYYSRPYCISSGVPYSYAQYIDNFNLVVTNYLPPHVLIRFGTLTWRNIRTVRLGQHNRLEAQVTRMILAELVMVCATTLPNIIWNSYSLATRSIVKYQLRIAQVNLWSIVSAVFTILSYCGSFYVLCAVSPAYRKNVRLAVSCKKQNQVATTSGKVQNNTLAHINTSAWRRWFDT